MSDVNETLEERNSTHGDFTQQAECSQEIKKVVYFWARKNSTELTQSQRESLEMIAVKISRILNGSPNHADSWHDIAGYATLIVKELEAADEKIQE